MSRFLFIIILPISVILVTFFWLRFGINERQTVTSVILKKEKVHSMKLLSEAFANGENIPSLYTCRGKDFNPPLTIVDTPHDAKSLVLILDDPDAIGGTWVHWVVYNIAPSVNQIAEHSVPKDGLEGITSFGKATYGGPCPPSGIHHYHFKIYALDTTLIFSDPSTVDKQLVEEQMKEHIIDSAELVGLSSK